MKYRRSLSTRPRGASRASSRFCVPPDLWPLCIALPLLALGCSSGDDDDDSSPQVSPTPTATPAVDAALFQPTSWDNATVYFVMTDRFYDGDPTNNDAYGRQPDEADEIGTFHGGDLKGLTEKLEDNYFNRLGVSALWITAPYEQIHGWVVGGSGDFQHYAYHGYYALDFTKLDAAMGSEDDLKTFVDTAHAKGIRVLFDVVMNHPGYASIADLHEFNVDVLKPGWESATLSTYYSYIDFNSPNFANWWGVPWIRAGLGGGYETGGTDELTMSVAYLPDFKTEASETNIGLPPFYAFKTDTKAVASPDYAVRDYLVEWLTNWVEDYGIDGFRCDTVKHVENASWSALKDSAQAALVSWRSSHPSERLPDSAYVDASAPFWMTGEVYPHGVTKDAYFDAGFDSLINFTFQDAAGAAVADPSKIDATYQTYADSINTDPTFNMLSYISSHDTALFFSKYAGSDLEKQKTAGNLLILCPGAVQIFYGDENARVPGPKCSDATQPTRSDYVWGDHPDVLAHWRKLGQFRHRHEAVGAGSHQKIGDSPYTFRRALGDDKVYCVLGASGSTAVDVSQDFADGTELREFYSGATATVAGGKVTFQAAASGVLLVEAL